MTSLRRSEIFGLKWKDVDTKEKTLQVRRARVKNDFREYVEKAPKTTTSERKLLMPQILVDALKEAEGDKEAYVIGEANPDALDSLYKRAKEKYNFPYNFHSLRHYFASVMVKAGIPNKYAAEFMGHTTENMLQRVYQHTFQEDKARFATMMAQKMNELGKE